MKGFIFEHWPCLSIIVKVLVAQSCPTLCDPMDCSPPGSSVYGILQARILEWVAFPFSRGSSQPRDRAWVSGIAGGFLTIWATGKLQCYTWWLTVSFNLPNRPVRNTELTSFPNAKLASQKGKCILPRAPWLKSEGVNIRMPGLCQSQHCLLPHYATQKEHPQKMLPPNLTTDRVPLCQVAEEGSSCLNPTLFS